MSVCMNSISNNGNRHFNSSSFVPEGNFMISAFYHDLAKKNTFYENLLCNVPTYTMYERVTVGNITA